MVSDSKNWVYLAAEFLSQILCFPILQSLTRSTNDFEESNCEEVIKIESQSDIKKYQNPSSIHSDIDSTNPQSPSHPHSPTNIALSKRKPKRSSSFDNMSVTHILIKATEIKPLNKLKD